MDLFVRTNRTVLEAARIKVIVREDADSVREDAFSGGVAIQLAHVLRAKRTES